MRKVCVASSAVDIHRTYRIFTFPSYNNNITAILIIDLTSPLHFKLKKVTGLLTFYDNELRY